MESTFTWVDFSEEDRERMSAVVQLFRERETRDELGIGVVRDAIADTLFPGTSTIQTRARYFLFVPWIYTRHEKRRTPSSQIAADAAKDEYRLIKVLTASNAGDGIIGSLAGDSLDRLPSEIYWAGLHKLGIRRFVGSQDEYHRSFSSRLRRAQFQIEGDDEEVVAPAGAWEPGLPKAPADFLEVTGLALSGDEAEYLATKIDALEPRPFLSILIRKLGSAGEVEFPWFHPDAGALAAHHREQLNHAQNFSEAMHGAALLYNLMLAEKRPDSERIKKYDELFQTWSQELRLRRAAFEAWNRAAFWEMAEAVNAPDVRARAFIGRWLDWALSNLAGTHSSKDGQARKLIFDREWEIKRNRARLHNQRALERWTGSSGASQLNYRWHRVRRIVGDIREGLGKAA